MLLTASVPLAVVFVLTARPARLYAETAAPPSPCTDPDFEACAGKNSGAACAWDGATGTCQSTLCQDPDSGYFVGGLHCVPTAVGPDGGPDAGAGGDAGGDAAASPGGSAAGGPPAEGCSCSAAGVTPSGALSSGAGLLLALGAMLRVRRRRSTQPTR